VDATLLAGIAAAAAAGLAARLWMARRELAGARLELEHRAAHDELTGLANRALLEDRIEHALARGQRSDRVIALLSLNFDRFKAVNDTWGHATGDAILVESVRRLQNIVRPGDTIARVSGDEFAVLCEELADVDDACMIAERMLEALDRPFTIGGDNVAVTASIGLAVHELGQTNADALLRDAEAAMYLAKGEGRSRWELYDAKLRARVQRRRDTEAALQGALERGELRLVYQPVVHLASGEVRSFEALVRWARPGHGLVMPDEFIGLAEESHLILVIGEWVLEQACRQISAWNNQCPDRAPLSISVNVSGRQFADPEFATQVERAIVRAGVDPQAVILEITETVLVHAAEHALAQVERIKRLGVRLAVDDFGTGYSSLAYLRHFPLDVVKIDRMFIEELGGLVADSTVVAAVIRLAQVLGHEVVAEGAETAQQMNALYALGCDYVQGFYFAPPLTQAQAELLVRGRRDLVSVRDALQHA
jgi:diguanylate cyclase (GGDEF)-like protein